MRTLNDKTMVSYEMVAMNFGTSSVRYCGSNVYVHTGFTNAAVIRVLNLKKKLALPLA